MSDYIDNNLLYESLKKYHDELAKSNSKKVKIPNDIGEAILKICTNLARRPNFSGYTYKDEMISDAIESCIYATDKFDPVNYDKPFAYYTKIAWWAFLRRIDKEKKHSYIKHKSLEHFATQAMLAGDSSPDPLLNNHGQNEDLIKKFEK